MARCWRAAALGLGCGFTATLTYVWWVAVFRGWWAVPVTFNVVGEAWVEGLLLHIASMGLLALFFLEIRRLATGRY